MSCNPRRYKIKRIRGGHVPRVLELFEGCGGLSLGVPSEGFRFVGGCGMRSSVVKLPIIFFPNHEERYSKPIDITKTPSADLVQHLKIGNKVDNCVAMIIGGSPKSMLLLSY